MPITFDPDKREKTWRQRGLDFADAVVEFSGATLELQDTRQDYGETRIICFVLVCLQAGWWWDTHRVARIAMFLA